MESKEKILTRQGIENLVFEDATPETILALSLYLDELEAQVKDAELRGATDMLNWFWDVADSVEAETKEEFLAEYKKARGL